MSENKSQNINHKSGSLKQTNNNGIVILHYCNPPSLEHTLIPRVQPQWNGDVYKSILKFRKNNKKIS